MSTALHWATLAAYLAATVIYLAFVVGQRRPWFSAGRAVLWAGFALHTAALVAAWIGLGHLPAATLRQSLDVFSWGLVGATLVMSLRMPVMILGALAAPLAALLLLAAAVLPASPAPVPPVLKSAWVAVHVFTLLFGYGLLALTFLGGVLYLLQERAIRKKRLGPLFKRLPPLSRLDSLNHNALVGGFTLLTVGLITGAIYAQITLGSYWRWDPKEVWALITWLLYAALLHARLASGWRGRRGAWLATAAFVALIFTFIGVGLWLPGYHSFGALSALPGGHP